MKVDEKDDDARFEERALVAANDDKNDRDDIEREREREKSAEKIPL